MSFVGNNNPSRKVLEHTINLCSHIFVKASIVLGTTLEKREKEYIELASRGYTLKKIAQLLGISISTAKANRDTILQKLFCKNMPEAISLARKYRFSP